MMDEQDADKAHEVLQQFDKMIIYIGAELLANLTNEQREYVLDKMADEFRFWRIKDKL